MDFGTIKPAIQNAMSATAHLKRCLPPRVRGREKSNSACNEQSRE